MTVFQSSTLQVILMEFLITWHESQSDVAHLNPVLIAVSELLTLHVSNGKLPLHQTNIFIIWNHIVNLQPNTTWSRKKSLDCTHLYTITPGGRSFFRIRDWISLSIITKAFSTTSVCQFNILLSALGGLHRIVMKFSCYMCTKGICLKENKEEWENVLV